MNRSIIIRIAFCLLLCMGMIPQLGQQTAKAQVSVSFQVFYDQLSPYGSWVDYPNYGYVWVPGAGSGFRPYGSRGHWVYTEDGWAWVSDYQWGWATFHYGSWFYDDSYGWMWMPGYQWAPAWVTWGEYSGNYCWAPIGPRVDIGVSFGSYRPPVNYWNFCPRDRIMSTHVSNYYVTSYRNTTVINNITVINNVHPGAGGRGGYLRGPQPNNVERFTHQNVRPMAIQASSRPGPTAVQGGRLNVYRPNVQQSGGATPRPSNIRELRSLPARNGAVTPRPSQPGRQPAQGGQPAQHPRPSQTPRPGQPSREGQQQNSPHPAQQAPRPQPGRQPAPGNQPSQYPHPSQTPRPGQPSQQHPAPTVQPHPTPQQTRPVPQQQRPVPQQSHSSPRPAPQPNRQTPQPQPHQQPQRPTPQPRPQPQPQPHENPPAPRPAEHHQ